MSRPTEKGENPVPYIFGSHVLDGIRYNNFVLDSSIEGLKNFEVRPDDIWIVTYPKSGDATSAARGQGGGGGA